LRCFFLEAEGTVSAGTRTQRRVPMADVNRFSEGLIDAAERFADVVQAMQGNGARKGSADARWLILPAAGAAAYALATSSSNTARRTRGLMRRVKDRATDLPDTVLFERVKEVTGLTDERESTTPSGRTRTTNGRTQGQSGGRASTNQRRRKTASSK
jgi:hypothetical protein